MMTNTNNTAAAKTITRTIEAGQHAEIAPRKSIRLHGVDNNHRKGPVQYDRTFAVGDVACYDSFNLVYLGTITGIGAKTVTIKSNMRGVSRLSTANFSFFNKHLDVPAVERQNAEELMCL